MKRLEKLTPEQERELQAWRLGWLAVGCDTRPADRARAERAVLEMRRLVGVTETPLVVWVDSPATGCLALHWFRSGGGKAWAERVSAPNTPLWASLGDSLGASLRASLWASLWASLGDSLGASLGASLWASLGDSLGASLRASLGASLGASLWASLGDSLWDSLRDSLGASLGDSLGASLWASLGDSLGASLRASLWDSLVHAWWGQQEAYWIAFYRFCEDVLHVEFDPKRSAQLRLWQDIAQSCSWWWCYRNVIVLCERPTHVSWEPDRTPARIHSTDGPAVAFRDGWSVYAVRGTRVPERVIMAPASLTAAEVLAEPNAEVRRVMMERFGGHHDRSECLAALLSAADAKTVHRHARGTLLRLDVPGDEPIVGVLVTNSTPEPDGPSKQYLLRVPPDTKTVPAALAWTFPARLVTGRNYRPEQET